MSPSPRPETPGRLPVALVVAKAPVTGRVKTRLGREVGAERAARLAAAALLDTMEACVAAYGTARCHLAVDGDLSVAQLSEQLAFASAGWRVHRQRGTDLATRLVHAHQDVSRAAGAPVVQVGMDTPQLPVSVLREAADRLDSSDAAVLGPAVDGGWWLLGAGSPALLRHLAEVPMSTDRTGELTRAALTRAGARVTDVATLRDVDEVADAEAVARSAPGTRFARAWR